MVHFFKKTLLILILILSTIISISHTYSATWYLTLTPESSNSDITKIQTLFKTLSIYAWEADWNYNSIKSDIIAFQVNKKIIENSDSDWAWYIWPKTYAALTNFYWKEFSDAYGDIFDIQITPEWENRTFIVSAYYSPLPGQKKYATWSYARDIRLNWQWTHWASWVAVHPWFIAAPSNYTFGTKIYIEWLGVGTVEDRWWAIVNAWKRWHEHDRLDIWMWYWDEWLTRALNWWKKTVSWKIVSKDSPNTIEYSWERVDRWDSLAIEITPESSGADIAKMQEFFEEANLYSGDIDWNYDNFKSSIIDFQIENNVIKTRTSNWNWYIWTKTITKLEQIYPEIFLVDKRKELEETQEKIEEKVIITTTTDNLTVGQKQQIDNIVTVLNNSLEKKYSQDKLILTTEKYKMSQRIFNLINQVEEKVTKEKIQYLYDEFKKNI